MVTTMTALRDLGLITTLRVQIVGELASGRVSGRKVDRLGVH